MDNTTPTKEMSEINLMDEDGTDTEDKICLIDLVDSSPNESFTVGDDDMTASPTRDSVSKPALIRSAKKQRGATNTNQTMKFLENFDPEHSNRERKKLTRQITSSGKKKPTMYDEKGVMIGVDLDLCDCLEEDCPGCHFPCPKCHSNKCGHDCRQNRRWTYEEMWAEGSARIKCNPLFNKYPNGLVMATP